MYECQAGEIKHALRFTIPHSSKGYIFPARHYASSNTDTTNVMPMGLRCRLKASFDDSKDTGFAKVIITAMKRYGIIMADNGSSWYVSGENNTSWPDNDINQLKAITGNDFEAVYSGPIRTFPNEFPDPIFPLDTTSTKTTIGKFHITSNPFQFGNVTVGNTDSLTFSMTNTGDGELDISVSNLQGTNADFKLVTPLQLPPFKLAPGGSISATISFTPSGAGVESTSYTLTVTDQPGHSFDTIITLTGVGVSQAGVIGISGQPAQLSIYPNPASKGMAVAMPNQSGSIVIVDALGRTRITGTLRNGIASLDLGNLPNGSYFVRIATKEGVISKPIQVLH